MLALGRRGEGGGGLDIVDSGLEEGGEVWQVEVLLLFLLNCSYILYRENTDTVAGWGKGVELVLRTQLLRLQGTRH